MIKIMILAILMILNNIQNQHLFTILRRIANILKLLDG